jgi:flagellar biosynthetic protein FlhB
MPGNEEKTEQASPKRRRDAREKGQVARSMEVNAAVGLLAGLVVLQSVVGGMMTTWREDTAVHFARAATFVMTTATLQDELLAAGRTYLVLTMPVLLVTMVAGVASSVLQTGFMLSGKPIVPDFTRLNPMQGFARLFSTRSALDALKAAGKATIIGYLMYAFFREHADEIASLMISPMPELGPRVGSLVWDLLMQTTMATMIFAGVDYGLQRWEFEKSLKMTKQDQKEEYKSTEGDPLIKSRTRQRQREISRNRMMADVRTATVVLTNPTHLAVALRYEPGVLPAPQVVAKGKRLLAERIKQIARDARVPVIEQKPVARALYADCRVGDMIPAELYHAVAEIIAFVLKRAARP